MYRGRILKGAKVIIPIIAGLALPTQRRSTVGGGPWLRVEKWSDHAGVTLATPAQSQERLLNAIGRICGSKPIPQPRVVIAVVIFIYEIIIGIAN